MIEIKFLKALPIKCLNKNSSTIAVRGADIYVDKDGNRFAYIEFENLLRQDMYSLYFVLKQYDSMGTFIKEVKFSLPSILVSKGKYIIERPIKIDEECDGVEVYVSYVEFTKSFFFNDKLSRTPHLDSLIPNFFEGAPKEVSSSFFVASNSSPVAEAKNSDEEVKPVSEANPQSSVIPTTIQDVPENVVTNENLQKIDSSNADSKRNVRSVGVKFNWINFALAVVGIVIITIAIMVSSNFILGTI